MKKYCRSIFVLLAGYNSNAVPCAKYLYKKMLKAENIFFAVTYNGAYLF